MALDRSPESWHMMYWSVAKEIWFKDFSSYSHVVQPSRTFWTILVEGIMKNISVILFWIWTSGSGEDVVNSHFSPGSSGNPFVQWSGTYCAFLVEDILGTILWNYFEFGPAVQEEMSFKDISYLELLMPFSSGERTIWAVFMPPTFKKLRGHIALGLSVRPSVCYKFEIGFWNFIDAFLIKK